MGNAYSSIVAEMSQMDPISMEDLITMNAEWKEGHGKNTGILFSVSAITSTIASSTLIWMIARSHKGLSTTQHRILLGLSICDLISSLGYSTFNSTSPSDNAYRIWNARGTVATCDAQGFLILLGVYGGLYYNASLNVYYLARVKYKKSEDYIRTKIEPFLHGLSIGVALIYPIVLLVVGGLFNENGSGNCVAPVYIARHCQGYDMGEIRDGFEIPCWRGIEGAGTILVFTSVSFMIPVVIIVASLVVIYRAVKKVENKLAKYGVGALNLNNPQHAATGGQTDTSRGGLWKRLKMSLSSRTRSSSSTSNAHPVVRSNNMQSQSRAVMLKAVQYSFAWILSYGIIMIYVAVIISTGNEEIVPFLYINVIFGPLQGFYNLLIYMYPKVMSARKTQRGQEKLPWCKAISDAFLSRGKDTKRNRPGQAANLRGGDKNRPLKTKKKKNENDDGNTRIIKTPELFRKQTKKKQTHREPKEEEEKCEIQPTTDILGQSRQNASYLTYAPNLTHSVPNHIHDMDPKAKEVRKGGVSENRGVEEGDDDSKVE